MAGLYLTPQKQAELNEIVRRYPSISVISVSAIIAQVRTMLASISAMVKLLLYLLLIAGLLGYWQIRDVATQPPMRLLSSTQTDTG